MPEFSSPIDLGIPGTPVGVPEEYQQTIQQIFDALRLLQQKLGDYAGLGVLDPTNYLTLAVKMSDSIQVQRMQSIIVTASASINAKDFINLYSSTGIKARQADASAIGKRAWGWAPDAIGNGSQGIVHLLSGYQSGAGLTEGSVYYLSSTTPGGITTTAPSASGTIKQEIGLALSTTELLVRLSTPIINP
jgi:hypothetical protein